MYYRWPGNIRELMSTVERASNAAIWSSEDQSCIFSLGLSYPRLPSKADKDLATAKVNIDELLTFDLRALLNSCQTFPGVPKWILFERMKCVEGESSPRPPAIPFDRKLASDFQSPPEAFPTAVLPPPDGLFTKDWNEVQRMCEQVVAKWRRAYVQHHLEQNGHVKKRVAEKMGITPATIRNILNTGKDGLS